MNASESDLIDGFARDLDPKLAAVCGRLRSIIDRELPAATSKLWHAIPVWFVGENAVVGYDKRKAGIMLMFWNGQNFGTGGLEASGSFHVGQRLYADPSEIDEAEMSQWLAEAGTNIWDMVGERRAFIAKRKAGLVEGKAKGKTAAKSAAKVKTGAGVRIKAATRGKARSKVKPKTKVKPKAKGKPKTRIKTNPKSRGRAKKAK